MSADDIFVPDPIVLIDLPGGIGAFATENIYSILPDMNKPKTHSVICLYTGDVINVIGRSEDVAAHWLDAVGQEYGDD